jgi:hypothetical protein
LSDTNIDSVQHIDELAQAAVVVPGIEGQASPARPTCRCPPQILVSQLDASVEADGHGEAGTQALVKALEKLGNIKVGE